MERVWWIARIRFFRVFGLFGRNFNRVCHTRTWRAVSQHRSFLRFSIYKMLKLDSRDRRLMHRPRYCFNTGHERRFRWRRRYARYWSHSHSGPLSRLCSTWSALMRSLVAIWGLIWCEQNVLSAVHQCPFDLIRGRLSSTFSSQRTWCHSSNRDRRTTPFRLPWSQYLVWIGDIWLKFEEIHYYLGNDRSAVFAHICCLMPIFLE